MKKILFLFAILFTSLSMFAQLRVHVPNMVSPDDGEEDIMPNVYLDWDAVTSSGGSYNITYECQIDTDENFGNPVVYELDVTAVRGENLLFGETYYWRVRAKDENMTSDWSEAWSFTIFNVIDLNKPTNGDDEKDPNEELRWKNKVGGNSIKGVTYFEYQTDTVETFDSPELKTYQVTNDPLGTAVTGGHASQLRFGTTYYWRARAAHEVDACDWSEIRNFEVWIAPELKDPDDGDELEDVEADFEWKPIDGVMGFNLEYAYNPEFTNSASNFVEDNEVTIQGFALNSTVYWRANAQHASDISDWSEEWHFTTPSKVILESPDNEEAWVNPLPQLHWQEIIGGNIEYAVQLDNSEDFSSPIINDTVTGGMLQVPTALAEGYPYYWRVKAMNTFSETTWGDTWVFYTPWVGIDEASLSKETVEIYPNPSNGTLYLNIKVAKAINAQISVIDLLGQTVHSTEASIVPGMESIEIQMNELQSGIYMLRIESSGNFYTEKFLIDK